MDKDPEKDSKMGNDPELGDPEPWAIQASKSMGRSSRKTSLSRSRSLARETITSASIGPSAGQSYGLFGGGGNPLDSASRHSSKEEDEADLRWAALEKLPTYKRIRTSILQQHTGSVREVDVKHLSMADFHHLLQTLHRPTDNEDEQLMAKMRKRLDRVGLELPTIEVRYENLTVKANCHVGTRGLPTLWNITLNILESFASLVHLSPSKKEVLTILDNVNGVIKPGRMTLLLGPPGSGKTTLLLALAAKLDSSLKVQGKVTFNGHTPNEFVAPKTAAYISQHDLHVGELTMRETLQFSSHVQGVGPQYEMLEEVSRREKESGIRPDRDVDTYMKATAMPGPKGSLAVEYILKTLGLDICADTVVGDEMRRGISGGQKKRVTTGEMIVGPLKALFMDEISTGLDSSTTFTIVRSLCRFTHEMSATTLISLLQPAPGTFNLFDDVLLLSEGQVVYHGPINHVVEFFELCGFKCPERKGIADFLQEVTSRKDQEQYWSDKRKPYRFVPVRFFAEEFQNFHIGMRINDELAVPYPKEKSHPAALAKEKYSISNKDLFLATFDRELTLFKRNGIVAIIKAIQITVMAFISMTAFFRTRLSTNTVADGGLYFNALFYAVMTFMFTGFGELASTIGRLPVLIKQRDMLFIPAWAYSVSVMVLSIPTSVLEVGIFTCMSYFVTGFAPEAGAFFKYFLMLFLIQQQAGGMFRFIGAVCRTMTLGFTLGWIILLLLFMLGGFIIPRPDLPVWWRWGYWISNMSYAVQGISANEFTASRWQTPYTGEGGVNTIGARILQTRGQYTESYWYWITIGALFGFYVIFNIGFTLGIQFMPDYISIIGSLGFSISMGSTGVGKPQAIMSKEELEEKEANRIGGKLSNSKSSRSRSRSLAAIMTSKGEAPRHSRSHRSSTSHRPSDSNVEDVAVEVQRGMILPFQPLSISFNDISYFVDMPAEMKSAEVTESRLQLLNKITGAFRPGVLTALVGVSGAGKSTLMDVLAGRKTGGYIEGDIRICGYPKNQKTFARISGYCEQNDIHSPQVTIRESLIYSAWLRLASDIDDESKMAFVEEVLELVELKPLENALVGLPGITGLSTEQRKRLTIAVELVANPSIIFMDEPTSGLDARAAAIVMRCVRNTVDTGRTIVCTIHQPSIDIFEAFDELLLLKRGGQVIYAGELGYQSKHLVEYFEAVPGIPKIPEDYNPATWMLEVTNQDTELELDIDFAEHCIQSDLYKRNKDLVRELSVAPPGSKPLVFPSEYPLTTLQQLKTILWKQKLTYWRSPDYNLVRFAFTFFTGLICGSIFWQVGTKTGRSTDLVITLGALYGATLFISFNNASTVQTMVSIERSVHYREKAAGMYSSIPYALSQVLIEIPYVIVQSTLYCLITYSMLGFEWTAAKFFWYYYIMVISLLQFTYYGMMMVAITPNVILASIVSAFFSTIFDLFAGFLIPRPSIPGWWIWYYWACPLAWTVYGLIASQFGDITRPLIVVGDEARNINVKDYLQETFGFEHDFMPVVGPMIFVWMLLFGASYIYAIKFLNFQRR